MNQHWTGAYSIWPCMFWLNGGQRQFKQKVLVLKSLCACQSSERALHKLTFFWAASFFFFSSCLFFFLSSIKWFSSCVFFCFFSQLKYKIERERENLMRGERYCASTGKHLQKWLICLFSVALLYLLLFKVKSVLSMAAFVNTQDYIRSTNATTGQENVSLFCASLLTSIFLDKLMF